MDAAWWGDGWLVIMVVVILPLIVLWVRAGTGAGILEQGKIWYSGFRFDL